ncbi:hypothetical protein CANARDRAFT_30739 [[Candida] arabinofermentans NRRL YB-2248]|uniref:Phosphoglycerate mutase n=1 Tax=[Candida] arabinofermentans NRRL YB-2248 TaxID=983967 RepID=A0A1E4SSP7_9ASCO|nr:hypothetical protein CANARDRAFT_30739 [[Candida] arabinofermentans NRRL YB-2248]
MAKDPTPRCIFIRHGQTAWSKSGQHTSSTDIDLTEFGVRQMEKTGEALMGHLIDATHVKLIITSPRTRAIRTKDLLFKSVDPKITSEIPHDIDEDIREWEYGDYEGLLTKDIKKLRSDRGLGSNWNIWRDGCENGEDYKQVTERVDNLISKIRKVHKAAFESGDHCDVIVVAHGHILRCFAARWVGREINVNPDFMLDAGGVGVLSYQHHCIDEPALLLAGAFYVPVEEESDDL